MGFGPVPRIAARPVLAKFMRDKATRIAIRYDWIKAASFWDWLHNNEEVEFSDGAEWFELFSLS